MQKKYWRTTHKFKIEVPTSVKSMYEIDNKTGTDFWRKLVAKEIINEKVAQIENKQITVESSKLGSEFVAMKIARYPIVALS